MSVTCSKCRREMTLSDDPWTPLGLCLECDPKGWQDELPDPLPGELGYVPPDPPEPERWWRISRKTSLHPLGWVTVLTQESTSADMAFVKLDLEGRYPDQTFRLEEVE